MRRDSCRRGRRGPLAGAAGVGLLARAIDAEDLAKASSERGGGGAGRGGQGGGGRRVRRVADPSDVAVEYTFKKAKSTEPIL